MLNVYCISCRARHIVVAADASFDARSRGENRRIFGTFFANERNVLLSAGKMVAPKQAISYRPLRGVAKLKSGLRHRPGRGRRRAACRQSNAM